jgi:aspartate-semialdehyde dehydrogenase
LYPVSELFPVESILACTYQAISGSGKNFETWPEMIDNVIPYIGGGEEEKSEREPLKIWGEVKSGVIVPAASPAITAQCIRVPVTDGHLAAVFVRFGAKKPSKERIIEIWDNFVSPVAKYNLPSAPKKFLRYFTEIDRPQTKLDRDLEGGMAVSMGRLREDTQYDYKFVCLSHNTLRGAAGGAVELAELLCAENYITVKS